MLQTLKFAVLLACPVVPFATYRSFLPSAVPPYARYTVAACTYHNFSIMSLTADAFIAYMDKQKQERSEDIEQLTKTFTKRNKERNFGCKSKRR
jgi:hypothetical protein